MVRFYLYRVIVTESRQQHLFTQLSRKELLRSAFHAKPSISTRGTVEWHLGNVEDIENSALYFRVGKTGKTLEARFDEETADFVDTEFENAPYTHGFLDLEYQVCVIATNARLAPVTRSIANRLSDLLQATQVVNAQNATLDVAEIVDPSSFIETVESAYAVLRFTVGFGLPNPFDANEDFQKPMQNYLASLGGDQGSTTASGKGDLDRKVIADMARAAAATGKTASAKLKVSYEAKPQLKKMEGMPATLDEETIPEGEARREFVRKIIAAYIAIRGHDQKR